VPVNQGVIASFWLVSENSGSWSFLQVGASVNQGVGSGWCRRIQGVVASFRLVPVNQGVGASFQLVLENLEVGASYECILDIYKKAFCGFLPFGFPHKFWCTMYLWILLNDNDMVICS
jgi:hypothetical protein